MCGAILREEIAPLPYNGGVILHERREDRHHYYRQEREITYHYQRVIRDAESTTPLSPSEGSDRAAMEVKNSAASCGVSWLFPMNHDVRENAAAEENHIRGWRVMYERWEGKAASLFSSLRDKVIKLRRKGGATDEVA